jgi:hypothetical protein
LLLGTDGRWRSAQIGTLPVPISSHSMVIFEKLYYLCVCHGINFHKLDGRHGLVLCFAGLKSVQLEPEQGELWVRVIPDADDELTDVEAVARRLDVVPSQTTATAVMAACAA